MDASKCDQIRVLPITESAEPTTSTICREWNVLTIKEKRLAKVKVKTILEIALSLSLTFGRDCNNQDKCIALKASVVKCPSGS